MPVCMIANLGATELSLVLVIVVLLFGATKLPDLARNSGRALRIFKAETRGLFEGDDDRARDDTDELPEHHSCSAERSRDGE